MMNLKNFNCSRVLLLSAICLYFYTANVQGQALTDANAPLHALKVDYPTKYEIPTQEEVKDVLDRVYSYLHDVTPATLIDQTTDKEVKTFKNLPEQVAFAPGDFRLTSYEWGVAYAGMIHVATVTDDEKYRSYSMDRLQLILKTVKALENRKGLTKENNPVDQVMNPEALDDAGAMCAAMIKTGESAFRPLINNYIDYISNKQFRLEDGTLARNRPHKNTIWLDDLFMAVPALAQMGNLTGEPKYFDDAVEQVLQVSRRMFNEQKLVYMHGWVQEMEPHPQFHWARANGWAIMAMAELLDVLPEAHPGRAEVLNYFQKHAEGLAAYQAPEGFWHQLLDRNDSYLETSATAIYAYSIAKGINNGWLDAKAYGPVVALAWNAVSRKVNERGQVEGTCVGTGMAFDPAFYYFRPVTSYAAHGYGPVLLAGSEIIKLIGKSNARLNDSALTFYDE